MITVCDSAAKEPCPVLFGDFVRAHWGLPDPAAAQGSFEKITGAFRQAHALITHRLRAMLALPVENMEPAELKRSLDRIGEMLLTDIEVPVMLSVVRIVTVSKSGYEQRAV